MIAVYKDSTMIKSVLILKFSAYVIHHWELKSINGGGAKGDSCLEDNGRLHSMQNTK